MSTAITISESFVVDEEIGINKEKSEKHNKIEFFICCIKNTEKSYFVRF